MGRLPRSVGALIVGVLLAACGGQAATQPGTTSAPASSGAMTARFVSPSSGTVVTGNSIDVNVQVSGFQMSCALAGKAPKAGFGHYHIELDHALVNMYCSDTATISLQNVAAGQHTLTVLPALNNHEEVTKGKEEMTFTYRPSSPPPAIASANVGTPSIKILSP